MSEIDIDNWIASGEADEWAVQSGYIHKDEILPELVKIERELVSLMTAIQLLKHECEARG